MGPIDYSTDVQTPFQAALQGFKDGAAVRQVRTQQDQQQVQLQQQQQMQTDLRALSTNPTPDAVARMSVRYPQLSEQFKRSYDMLKPEHYEQWKDIEITFDPRSMMLM